MNKTQFGAPSHPQHGTSQNGGGSWKTNLVEQGSPDGSMFKGALKLNSNRAEVSVKISQFTKVPQMALFFLVGLLSPEKKSPAKGFGY